MEKAKDSDKSALDVISQKYGFKTAAIVTMDDVIESLWKADGSGAISNEIKKELDEYYAQWGAK